jgi:DNA polymerase I-like protein with 3'-5' exonuclease and polymerase domains
VSVITLDFETYYSKEFSLTKYTTEEYIRDKQFEVIGVAFKLDDGPTKWVTGTHEEIKAELDKLDWQYSALLCHNTMFDGAILAWIFGIKPAFYMDTLCMARAVHGVDVGGSLAALVKRYNLGEKGTEVVNALGKKRADFTAGDLDRYGSYCINDVDLTFALFDRLSKRFPGSELELIDLTLRMFIDPVLMIDDGLLVSRLEDIKKEKSELLRGLIETLKVETEEEVRKKLSSNKQFAAVLESKGIVPPTKTSSITGKVTFALAKNDEGFIALKESEDPIVQQLCAVRLGTKSTLEESRIERFISIRGRHRGRLPIPLKYYGAHTGRWSGMDSVNLQNLPSRDKKKKALKNSVVAPPGHVVINCDSSQIEARVLAWLAGQTDVVEQFRKGEDVYSIFASKIYGRSISKADPVERFVGKTCVLGLGYGTGALKLRHTLKTQPPGADLSEEECRRIVTVYRTENNRIPELWNECDRALEALMEDRVDGEFSLGKHEALWVSSEGIRLPNHLYIRYPNLRLENGEVVYDSRRGMVKIWGGSVVENVVQALARIIVGEQMLKIREKYRPVLTVHDAAVMVVPKDEADEAVAFITKVMSTPPDWCSDLPVACEAKWGESYGECG